MSGHPGAPEALLLAAAVPGCVPMMAGLGMALVAACNKSGSEGTAAATI